MAKIWFPLTEEEREAMKQGKEVMKHYHNVVFPEDTVAVIVGKGWKKSKYDYLLPRGIDIIPIHLTDEQIDSLQHGVLVGNLKDPTHGFPVEVNVVSAEKYAEFQRKMHV